MTRQPDLGLVLAGAGLVVILAAVIGGFIAVGGPGQARSVRLDMAKMDRMRDIGRAAACAASATGDVPTSIADFPAAPSDTRNRSPDDACLYYDAATLGDPKGVHYERIDKAHVRLCGDFLLPYDRVRDQGRGLHREEGFPELAVNRPAGNHCYDIKIAG